MLNDVLFLQQHHLCFTDFILKMNQFLILKQERLGYLFLIKRYKIKLIPGPKSPEQFYSYNNQLKVINKVMEECNISSSHKTHIGRGGGARECDDGDVADSDTNRMGNYFLTNKRTLEKRGKGWKLK